MFAWTALALGAVFVCVGTTTLISQAWQVNQYALKKDAIVGTLLDPSATEATSKESSWLNTPAVGWLSVANTSIDYPVVQATAAEPNYYLNHDLWGEDSSLGCVYIDERASKDGCHILMYGHNALIVNGMFSPLRTCYNQESFDELGDLLWQTANGSRYYKPLCAQKIDKTNQFVQQFQFANSAEFHTWIRELLKNASTKSPNAQQLASTAQRVITLVTCSELRSGQSGRSVVVFVS